MMATLALNELTLEQLVIYCIKSHLFYVSKIRKITIYSFINCHKSIKFKVELLGSMFIFIKTFENLANEFLNGCSVATRSYMSNHSVSEI